MNEEYRKKIDQAISNKKQNKKFFGRLNRSKPSDLDKQFHAQHAHVFENIDCLSCANCCKTTSPIFRDIDIERISSHLRVKPVQLIENYLKLDSEGDYVLQEAPCTFLNEDNTCSIYEHRPRACREFPHTDRKNMHQILRITQKNTEICPAVSEMVENIKRHLS